MVNILINGKDALKVTMVRHVFCSIVVDEPRRTVHVTIARVVKKGICSTKVKEWVNIISIGPGTVWIHTVVIGYSPTRCCMMLWTLTLRIVECVPSAAMINSELSTKMLM